MLTVGTDKPAFPPYFEDDDPTNGKGFESAVAYAIARELGFEQSEVEWTRQFGTAVADDGAARSQHGCRDAVPLCGE